MDTEDLLLQSFAEIHSSFESEPCNHENDEICMSLQNGARRILKLVQELINRLVILASESWERLYECMDLRDENVRLKERLENSITLEDWGKPLHTLRTALEADKEDLVPKLTQAIKELHKRHRDMVERLLNAMSRNWELEYKCRDLAGEIWWLKEHLRNSVLAEDSQMPSLKPKTALEDALEKEIQRLKEGERRMASRSRSRSM
ncbi:predicted protein [Chaetomium globosum CBS 148.51]|uniref:Uncharacterized protein n=1 Tax=Chaetomium globosum (strain ATCC 6205 / CBS 148.51 / DSM 1962 / NBRC 6347 / NRRL 1970) TaxID=306901 RepID=Q2GWU7_CHAGB|nr:uncharacterized protein CHGG_07557 [Chaetomium globosum CBS 148.51]EAQ86304.1 predicted protein [Chaetomium globosum CBS 148.51]